jgi:hypothetical protein
LGCAILLVARACLIPCAAWSDGYNSYSSVVDIFNVTAGTWSTAALSLARGYLAATSLPDAGVAIFAGGASTSCDCLFGVVCCRIVIGVRGMRVIVMCDVEGGGGGGGGGLCVWWGRFFVV